MPATNSSKSIFASKTFWLNVLGVAATFVPGLPIAPATIGYIVAGLNVANRLLTDGPAHLVPPPS